MYVVRINNSGEYMDSRPCQQCSLKLQSMGVRHIVYSDGVSFTKTDLRNYIHHENSSGYKFIEKLAL